MSISTEKLKKDYFQLDVGNYAEKIVLFGDISIHLPFSEVKDFVNIIDMSWATGKFYNKADTGQMEMGKYFRKRSYVNSYNAFDIPLTYQEVLEMKPEFDHDGKLIPPCGWRIMTDQDVFKKGDFFVYGKNSLIYSHGKIEEPTSGSCGGCIGSSIFSWKRVVMDGVIFYGLRRIETVVTVKVDGIDVPLTEEQIKFVEESKKAQKEEDEKYNIKIGEFYVKLKGKDSMKITKSSINFTCKNNPLVRKATSQEIAVWENRHKV